MTRSFVFLAVVASFFCCTHATRQRRQAVKGEVPDAVSLLRSGVYIPDQRFSAFIDGVMVNMVAEMRRKRLDPLYFRVYNEGEVEHVPTTSTRGKRSVSTRSKRQTSSALGGGVIRGISTVKRFGNAEVQVAGNTTLIRGHWLMGPLYIIIDYRGDPSITRVRTELQAVQFDTLTAVDKFGAEMKEFELNKPLFDYMAYFGNRTMDQQQTTELAVKELFTNNSFMVNLLREAFEIASYDKIIPQFGTDDRYYSVLQYLFSGQQGRDAREAIQQYQKSIKKDLLQQKEHAELDLVS